MNKIEIVGTNYYSNGSFEYHEFTPELSKDLNDLMDNLPAGAKVGIEFNKEIIENLGEGYTDAIDSSTLKSVRKDFFGNVIDKCKEKGLEVITLLDDDLCKKGKEISKNWSNFSDIGEGLEQGFNPQTDFEVENMSGEKVIKPYYELETIIRHNFNYWKFVELPDSIFQKVDQGDFDLVVLSHKTLGYFARQRPALMDYSKIDVRSVSLEEVNSEEVIREKDGVVFKEKTLRKSKLVSYDLDNYPKKKIRDDFGYRLGDREKIIADHLATSDIIIRI